MSKKIVFLIFTLLCFLNTTNLIAQNRQEEKQPLITILKSLEETYNISFSYAVKTIKDINATPSKNDLSLQDVLEFLKIETNLDFKILDNRFVTIKKIKNKKKLFNTQRLDEIVVNNYLTSGISRLNDGSIKIKPEAFGILPGLIETDLLQTIQALPGILSSDEKVSKINVRGGTHDQNLILWDGIKMYQSGHFFGLISAFSPYTTKRINIYKNGTRAKYGDGISSIIDMELPNNIDNKFKANLGFNLINLDVFAKIPLSTKTELQVSARRSITDFIKTTTFKQYSQRIFQDSDFENSKDNENSISQNESFYFYDFTLKFLYDISKKDKIRLHFFNVHNDLNYDETLTKNNRNETLNSQLSQRNSAVNLTYTKDWSNHFSATAQLYVTNYDLDATNYDILNNQRLVQVNEVFDGSAQLDITYTPNYQFKINGGYQFTEVGISNLEDVNNPDFRSLVRKVLITHAIYGETEFLSNNAKTKLILGGRLNHIPKFNMLFAEPRLSFSQRFLNNFRFEILGEFKSQTTSQVIDLQNDFLGIENRRWVLSNNKNEIEVIGNKRFFPIPIVKSKQVSAGLHFNKNDILVSAEGYIKKAYGISSRSQGFQNQYQFTNAIGNYEVKGLDLLLNKKFYNLFSSWVSYSLSKNNYTFNDLNNGKPFPNNADIRHAVSFGGSYTHNNLKLALGLNWRSGIPYTEPDVNVNNQDNIILYASPNSSNLEDYMRTDCSITYNFNVSDGVKAVLGASVWNLLNKKNTLNVYYTLDNQNTINKVENKSLGLTPNMSFQLQF